MTATSADRNDRAEGLPERRSGTDRRRLLLQSFLWQFLKSRRVGERRVGHDGVHHYVDVHGAGLFLVILLILVMCIADAYLTLTLLEAGAVEVNPVMRAAIEEDQRGFFYTKYLLTACSLVVLFLHKNYRMFGRLYGRHILVTVLLIYALLIGYEISLLTRLDLSLLD